MQHIGEGVGDFTARQNFVNSVIKELQIEKQKILEGKHSEDVTSAVNQTADYRAAGLNPDLTGGSNVGAVVPGNIDQSELPGAGFNDGNSEVVQIGNSIISLIQFGFSVASSVQGLQSGSINLANQALEQRSNVLDLFGSEIQRNFTPEQIKTFLSGKTDHQKTSNL